MLNGKIGVKSSHRIPLKAHTTLAGGAVPPCGAVPGAVARGEARRCAVLAGRAGVLPACCKNNASHLSMRHHIYIQPQELLCNAYTKHKHYIVKHCKCVCVMCVFKTVREVILDVWTPRICVSRRRRRHRAENAPHRTGVAEIEPWPHQNVALQGPSQRSEESPGLAPHRPEGHGTRRPCAGQ